jgi:hypothetical protein
MARQFLARPVYGYVSDDALASIDELTRRTNPEIPREAQTLWKPELRTMCWVWDDRLPAEKDEEER